MRPSVSAAKAAERRDSTSAASAGARSSALGEAEPPSQLASIRWPPWVSTDSGWNCTPSIGNVRWRIAITTPDSRAAGHLDLVRQRRLDHGERVVARGGERVRQPGEHALAAVVHQ